MSKLQIGRGAAFLYIENISTMIYGYAFWYILTKITTPDVIGISSSLITLAAIFASLASIGIPVGSQRFLGRMFLEGKFEDAKLFVKTSLLITSVGIIACSIALLLGSESLLGTYHYYLIVITVILIASSTISVLFRYVIIASLETKKLLIISVFSSGVKLVLTTILVFMVEEDELGVVIGFTVAPILTSILFAVNVRSLIKESLSRSSFRFVETVRTLLRASVVTWIPSLMDTIGSQIGIVVVLGIQGSSQAGFYFIALQITVGISAVIWALESITYPALSAMNSGRNVFLWRVIKIGLIIVLPLSSSALFYSKDIMQIFGQNYVEGSLALQLLLLSILPTAISAGISILMYSYGNYRQVLIIGLATSLPRVLLYFVFIPWYSGTGAALSFIIGSTIGLIVSILIGRKLDIIIIWKDLAPIFFIPMLFAFVLSNIQMHFVPAILISIILSYILLLRLEIMKRNDVQDSLSVLPSFMAFPIIETVNKIGSKLNKNY